MLVCYTSCVLDSKGFRFEVCRHTYLINYVLSKDLGYKGFRAAARPLNHGISGVV